MDLDRRSFVVGGGALVSAALCPVPLIAAGRSTSQAGIWTPFSSDVLRDLARELASRPFASPDSPLPPSLKKLGYDEYRSISYRADKALWRGEHLGFELQLFHRGFRFTSPVEIHEVVDEKSRRLTYSSSLFTSSELDLGTIDQDIGFSGFRLHAPINRADSLDEMLVFQGASYFRAVGKDQVYGISARGLAFRIAREGGEEFPIFRAFWIERPPRGATTAVVHALLDSASVTGAYRFSVTPGETTVMAVDVALFPRADLNEIGLAPLTSMYSHSPSDYLSNSDYRPSVHDSEGLEIWTASGEQIWRPLSNPPALQLSIFEDEPVGFGLMQRRRNFRDYSDLVARYEARPSLWVEPLASWGAGAIHLVELPTRGEFGDNIVAYWRPDKSFLAGNEHQISYRLHWGQATPVKSRLARFTDTLSGAGTLPGSWYFALDAAGEPLQQLGGKEQVDFFVSAQGGEVVHAGVELNAHIGGRRLAFTVIPKSAEPVDLRAQLTLKEKPISETWIYRRTP